MSRRALLAVAVAVPALVVASAASAEPPERTGWWNAVSAPGFAVPQPTTAEDDLRISRGADVLAFAAVLYPTDGSTSATLSVPVREGRTTGTPDVVACPTVDTAWEAGGNQSFDRAPEYDCTVGMAFGLLSPDGATLDFGLDATTQLEPGTWSLALVPNPEASGPFTIELQDPPDEAFTPDPPVEPVAPFVGEEPPSTEPEPVPLFDAGAPADVPFSPGTDLSSGSAGDGSAFAPLLADEAPSADLGAPLDQELPVIAEEQAASAPTAARRVAAAEQSEGGAARLLALLLLVGGCGVLGHAIGAQRPGPRLLGGRARALEGAGAVGAAGAAGRPAGPDTLTGRRERPRGIGRFARTREARPRGLR